MQPEEQHQAPPAEPHNSILCRIDDMGAFLAEHPGNATYWFGLICSRLCSCCVILMAIICVSFGYPMLVESGKAILHENPDYSYPLLWVMTFVFPIAFLLPLIYAVCYNRKNPLLYGLFEKGVVVVCRNKTHRRVFWDEIRRFRIITRGSKQPRICKLILEIATPEQRKETCQEVVPGEFFRNGEKLCRRILDFVPHAERQEKPNFQKREFIIMLALMVVSLTSFGLFIHFSDFASRSSVSKNWVIESQMTGETMRFSIYLPPGYHKDPRSGRKFPVLYLLHGFRDDHTSWPEHGELRRIADETIRSGKAVPMVIVMPHAIGGFYGNGLEGRRRYEDYFFTELIPSVEKHWRVDKGKDDRAIAGISMGGQGAFYYAMKYPESFSACCPMGGAFNFTDLAAVQIDRKIADADTAKNDLDTLLQKTAERHATVDLVGQQNAVVRFYFDCGEQDGLLKINRELDVKMQELDIPHEFRTRPGGHDWQCWQDALPDVLEFISAAVGR